MNTPTDLEENVPPVVGPPKQREKAIRTGRAISMVFLVNVTARLLSIVPQILTAVTFGTSADMDAYTVALVVPTTIAVILSAAVGAALVPVFIEYREKHGEAEAMRLFGVAITLGTLLGVMITGALIAGAPLLVALFGSQMNPPTRALAVILLRFLMPILLLQCLIAAVGAILNSYGRFAVAALAPATITVARILFLLLLARSWGIYALEWSTLLGYTLNLLALVASFLRLGLRFQVAFDWRHPGIRRIGVLAAPALMASLLVYGNNLVDQLMASLLPPGSLAAMGYALKLVDTPSQLFYLSLSAVLLPVFSLHAARRELTPLRDTFRQAVLFTAVVLLPASALLGVLAHPVVELLYQYGSFDSRSTDVVAAAITFLAPTVLLVTLSLVNGRMCNALQDNRTLRNIAVLSLVANAVLDYLLMQIWGVAGITFSTTLTYLISQSVLLVILSRKLQGVKLARLGFSLGKAALAAALMWLVCALLSGLPALAGLPPFILICVVGLPGVLLYIVLLYALRVPELGTLWALVRRRLPLGRAAQPASVGSKDMCD